MADDFGQLPSTKSDPANHVFLVTKSDTTDMPNVSRALLVDADMTAKIVTVGGETVESFPLQKGYNPVRVSRIYSTGTDAGDIFALY